jgi:hypothetical protein
MSELTNEEYLALCQKLVDQQYDDAVDDYDISKMEWIPAESEAKERMIKVNNNGMIDLTHVRSTKIKEEIFKCGNLKVGDFKIIISHYSGVPSQEGANLTCNLRFMGHQSKTMNGMPCNMDSFVNIAKDNRFFGRPWLKYFHGSNADNVPIDTVVDIIRWMQAIKKLTAFL